MSEPGLATDPSRSALAAGAQQGLGLALLATGHDNNLNLLRVSAAAMVLVSHSFVLTSGDPSAEPWLGRLGTTPGGLAVDIFFVISGFLVTASLERSRSLRRFAIARALRIYPALWVSLVLTLLMVGTWFTELSAQQFVQASQTWRWLGTNAFMVTAEALLPGAFLHVPYSGAVNGSLWTLRWELRCYFFLGLVWWLLRWINRRGTLVTFRTVIFTVAVATSSINVALHLTGRPVDYVQLGAMFFQGSVLWVLRDRVIIGWRTFGILGLAYLAGALLSPAAFRLANCVCLGWMALHLAYLPSGILRQYNRVGDYSYGIYIFAFPLQQAIVSSRPDLGPWTLALVSGISTTLVAILSWHCIEKRALRHKV